MGLGRQHALACLVAFYFCAINAALGWLMYHRDNHMLRRARALREPPALQTLMGLATPAPCRLQADLAVAVVPGPTHRPHQDHQKDKNDQKDQPDREGRNDLGPVKPLRLLQQLRRSTPHLRVAVLLLVTVDAFEPAHRQWCRAAPLCRLVLLEDAAAPALLRAVRAQALCTPHVLLLSDTLAVDSSFPARLRLLPAGRVACLLGGKHASASSGSTAGSTLGSTTNAPPNTQACPRLAFNLPTNFTIPADAPPDTPAAAIAHAAVRQARYAGAFPVVALA